MNSQETVNEFLDLFEGYRDIYDKHMEDYGEVLQHVFYAEVINNPLINLLKDNKDTEQIKRYISFIEHMLKDGDETVRNVVDVTILERLSDDTDIWNSLSSYISKDLRDYINNSLLKENMAMSHVKQIKG